jgi:hypothetical protein
MALGQWRTFNTLWRLAALSQPAETIKSIPLLGLELSPLRKQASLATTLLVMLLSVAVVEPQMRRLVTLALAALALAAINLVPALLLLQVIPSQWVAVVAALTIPVLVAAQVPVLA